jgi:DNA-binding NtrC family response regulator
MLLLGESGTGKSFVARRIHELSPRADRPFVEVGLTSDVGSDNMVQSDLFGHEKGAFTGASEYKEGLFSLADGGTIFLDEIGDASPEVQAKLLRVIESSTFKRLGGVRDIRVDVRVIAATNRDLDAMVREGSFREDLYYRLKVIPVTLPPLRERPEDIVPLVDYLLERAAPRGGAPRTFAPGLAARLADYPWPGNIRELDNALRHASAMAAGDEVTAADFPSPVRDCLGAGGPAREPAVVPPGDDQAAPAGAGPVIDAEALRAAIRSTDPLSEAMVEHPEEVPAHFAHAKRVYLEALIDECGGDLALISRFWDRSSEKTMRKLVREMGLEEKLNLARSRRPARRRSP